MSSDQPQEQKLFRVLDILSTTRLVLNCGSDDGIKLGTQFFIYALGPALKDVDGKEYEPLEKIRGYARAVHVQRTICTVDSRDYIEKKAIVDHTFSLRGLGNPVVDTVRVPVPFDDVQIGDYARVIS